MKSTLWSIPTYFMFLFQAPASVTEKLEKHKLWEIIYSKTSFRTCLVLHVQVGGLRCRSSSSPMQLSHKTLEDIGSWFGIPWVNPRTVKEVMFSWRSGRREKVHGLECYSTCYYMGYLERKK